MSYGGAVDANQLLIELLTGENIILPSIDLSDGLYTIPGDIHSEQYQPVTRLTNDDLTTRQVDGSGTFDALMAGFGAHLKQEYDKNRITGAEYTKAFIALTEGAMANAVQYLLGRDTAFWQAVAAQAAAVTARVNLQTAKLQYAALQLEAMTSRANYALTKLKLATEDVTYAQGKYQVDELYPQQLLLLKEQTEVQRAQTLDQRTDGQTVTGSVGKQKDLYTQQITSYQRNAEVSAAKLFTDAWITQKTIDEGLLPPAGFENASVNTILSKLKTNNNLG